MFLGVLVTSFLKGVRFGTQGPLGRIVPFVRSLLGKLLVSATDGQSASSMV